jgi:hypothetical protein
VPTAKALEYVADNSQKRPAPANAESPQPAKKSARLSIDDVAAPLAVAAPPASTAGSDLGSGSGTAAPAVGTGAALVGRSFSKKFGRKQFTGKVTSYDAAEELYHVEYSDGDEEDLDEEELTPLLPKPASAAPAPAAAKTIWQKDQDQVAQLVSRITWHTHLVRSYQDAGQADKSRIKPVAELNKSETTIRESKQRIMSIFRELTGRNKSDQRHAILGQSADGDSSQDNGIDVEDVACSRCGDAECSDGNDILLCDMEG